MKCRRFLLCLCLWCAALACFADETVDTNSFPSPAEVLQGRLFNSESDRSVFFLRAIHDQYPAHWPDLLQANITVDEYTLYPAKLLRFIGQLGTAMAGRNDSVACANLALLVTNQFFYTNIYHPEILQAAARALLQIGPTGRRTLASCFTVDNYRHIPAGLEMLAGLIGETRPPESELAGALTTAALNFTTAAGGWYPGFTTGMVSNLLRLPDGVSALRNHMQVEEMFDHPGRYQAVVEGIAAARAVDLTANLSEIETNVSGRMIALSNSPGAYRDALHDLDAQIQTTLATLKKP